MSADRIHYLLQQLLRQACTPEEKEELALWVDTLGDEEEWKYQLEKLWNDYWPDEQMDASRADTILGAITRRQPVRAEPVKIKRFFRKWQVAAAIVLLAAASFIYMERRPATHGTSLVKLGREVGGTDIAPGGNKAVWILANGTKIFMDSVRIGAKMEERATKIDSGVLAFNQLSGASRFATETEYNRVATPRGGQYEVILPDGSKVWLNAESSIRFPTVFAGDSRTIEITGEAYFEIVQNAAKPFMVNIRTPDGISQGTVQVLGTRFNINAYKDESAVKTTLLEGTIKISCNHENKILAPDQQAEITDDKSIRLINDADVSEAIAWKNGLFDFEGSDIQNVMRQVSRWYDVTVAYRNSTSAHFMGTISRNVNVSEVLNMLELTGAVHFDVEGKTITVLP